MLALTPGESRQAMFHASQNFASSVLKRCGDGADDNGEDMPTERVGRCQSERLGRNVDAAA